MSFFARLSDADKVHDPIPIERPFSNFEFLDTAGWYRPSFGRIFSQIRQHEGKTLIIEELLSGDVGELKEEDEEILKADPAFDKSIIWRLSFFSVLFSSRNGVDSMSNDDFLGYVIVKKDEFNGRDPEVRIYESVIKASMHQNNCIKASPIWECKVAEKIFNIEGYLYAQQNGISNCCAHVAIRTITSRFDKTGYPSYKRMNEIAGINLVSGYSIGLDEKQVLTILENSGLRCFKREKDTTLNVTIKKLIYSYIESGLPVIAIFSVSQSDSHAIPIFGHTFNEDTWVPRADLAYSLGPDTTYIPSESWLSMFIMHDDNVGSNYCVPHSYIEEKADYIIVSLPDNILFKADLADPVGADYLFTILPQLTDISGEWGERLIFYSNNKELVLRSVLISGDEYADHLEKLKDWQNNEMSAATIEIIRKSLKNGMLWMVELSIPELFSANRRKLGEIVLDACIDPKPHEKIVRNFDNFWMARLPGCFAIYDKGPPDSPEYNFTRNSLESHVQLFGCEEM